ncbi:T-cell surface glycoprotein CD3 epsilon chain-like [Centropristis striata]|uniref:T-cell surface glycoprotein CD3 epsilon chain-like n=1 Tax=Centropristis striata TaxID=184440 RepID=UPI0027E06F66|nr:T-cell surface glycoprotein CD3 epsilon chain-like [Centropristis striata]
MNIMGIQATLAVLLFVATVTAGEGGVSFWGKKFKMTCPEEGVWFKKGVEVNKTHDSRSQTYELDYDGKNKGLYRCEYLPSDTSDKPQKYHFYVKGKVCAKCFELDGKLFLLVIIVDVLGTVAVMLLICMCTRKKGSAGLSHASTAPARSGGRGPPVPSPDYEQLNLHTRSQDPYSVVNRMG